MNLFSARTRTRVLSCIMLAAPAREALAQREMRDRMPEDTTPAPDMMMTGPLGISTDRQGSGTSWIPESVQMPSRHALFGGWDVMSHWNVFGQYNTQLGPRGATQFGSINWSMVMGSRPLLGGRIQLRTMNSLDAATVGRCGYPLVLQTGETCHGAPNRDRQHPHDFFMEMGALYEHAFTGNVAWALYVAPSGEPALGPAAFMHRPSAMNDPFANITHHWQDATHITFGVVTGAVYGRRWKLEASGFNGREPDEHRWNFDFGRARLSSRSSRLTIHPSSEWSVSGSYGRLVGVEARDPGGVTRRAGASVLHGRRVTGRSLAAGITWGANRHDGADHWEHSILAEADLELAPHTSVFGRAEWVRKSAADLRLPGSDAYAMHVVGVGVVRELGTLGVLGVGAGARANVALVPEPLRVAYGSRHPKGLVLFLRARAKPMTAEERERMRGQMTHARMKMD